MGLLTRIDKAIAAFRTGGGGGMSRRSLENPSVPLSELSEGDDFWDACVNGSEGGARSAAGVGVSPESALRLSTVWRGVFLIARTVAKLPFYVYERDADGEGKHIADDHPAYNLLRWRPNKEHGAFIFKQAITAQAILAGNGYAYIQRNGAGDPVQLVPLLMGSTDAVRVEGKLWYVYTSPNGKRTAFESADVYHLQGPGLDGLTGIKLTRKAKESLGAQIAAQLFAGKYFENGCEPRIIFESVKRLQPEQRSQIATMWRAMHGGVENAHKTGIVEDGVTAKAFGADPESSQLLETRKYSAIEVGNWLHVNPSKLGDTSKAGYNGLEAENKAFLDDTIDPWLVTHEEEAREKLLTEEEKDRDTHTIAFLRQALLRADAPGRQALYHGGLTDGWLCPDEVRAMEDLNPMPDGTGKRFYRPLNMAPVGKEDDEKLLAFQRETVGAFIADGTLSDVIANLTDIKALAAAVGLPVEADYTEPWLPVLDDAGNPVSGDVITDPEGDIVGGASLPAENGDDGVAAGSAVKGQTGDPKAARARQQVRILRTASREVVVDAAKRMVRRLAKQAATAARSEGAMRDWLAAGLEENRSVVAEAFAAPVAAVAAAFGVPAKSARASASTITDGLLAEVRRRVMASDLTPAGVEKALAVKE